MTRNLTYHNDPGYGWLEVPLSDLTTLDMTDKISSCSYQDEANAYLEEDLDVGVYLRAARATGWSVDTKDDYSNNDSFVRRLPPYGG